MNPTTLEKPTHPKSLKAEANLSFILETTGHWEVTETPKPRTGPRAGTGAIKILFTERPGGALSISIQSMQVEPIPPKPPKWTIKGDGDLKLFTRAHGGKSIQEEWQGHLTCILDPTTDVVFTGKCPLAIAHTSMAPEAL